MPFSTPLFGTRAAASTGELDTMFQTVGLLGLIPCTASGTNSITLTPAVNTPVIGAYQNNLTLGFVAAATSGGAVTLASLGLPQLPVYLQDGVTQASSGSIVIGTFYVVNYVQAYNGGAGGWSLTGLQPASSPDFSLLATTDNPASSAFVAGSIGAGPSNNKKFRVGEVGGWSVLDEQVAAGSASLVFVLTTYIAANFEDFGFVFEDILPANNAVDFWTRFSTDGGATYDLGAGNYGWVVGGDVPGAANGNGNASDTHIQINGGDTLGFTSGTSYLNGRGFLLNPVTVHRQSFMSQTAIWTSSNRPGTYTGTGYRLASQDTDAIQFLMSAGAIAAGKVVLLGRRKVT